MILTYFCPKCHLRHYTSNPSIYDFLWARWVILHDSFSDYFKILTRGAVLLEEYM